MSVCGALHVEQRGIGDREIIASGDVVARESFIEQSDPASTIFLPCPLMAVAPRPVALCSTSGDSNFSNMPTGSACSLFPKAREHPANCQGASALLNARIGWQRHRHGCSHCGSNFAAADRILDRSEA